MADYEKHSFVTAGGILLFPSLFTPRAIMRNGQPTGDPFFSASLLLDPADAQDIITFFKDMLVERSDNLKLSELRLPLQKGETLIEREVKKAEREGRPTRTLGFYDGKYVLKTRTRFKPDVNRVVGDNVVSIGTDVANSTGASYVSPENPRSLTNAEGQVYSGQFAAFEVLFKNYDPIDDDSKPGIQAMLQSVLILKDGPKIASKGGDAKRTFASILAKNVDVDPLGGADDPLNALDDE